MEARSDETSLPLADLSHQKLWAAPPFVQVWPLRLHQSIGACALFGVVGRQLPPPPQSRHPQQLGPPSPFCVRRSLDTRPSTRLAPASLLRRPLRSLFLLPLLACSTHSGRERTSAGAPKLGCRRRERSQSTGGMAVISCPAGAVVVVVAPRSSLCTFFLICPPLSAAESGTRRPMRASIDRGAGSGPQQARAGRTRGAGWRGRARAGIPTMTDRVSQGFRRAPTHAVWLGLVDCSATAALGGLGAAAASAWTEGGALGLPRLGLLGSCPAERGLLLTRLLRTDTASIP